MPWTRQRIALVACAGVSGLAMFYVGLFQIESQGQMHLLAQHQPETFDDLISEIALFRPGPLKWM